MRLLLSALTFVESAVTGLSLSVLSGLPSSVVVASAVTFVESAVTGFPAALSPCTGQLGSGTGRIPFPSFIPAAGISEQVHLLLMALALRPLTWCRFYSLQRVRYS